MRKIALFVIYIMLVTSFTGIFSFESVAQNEPPFFGTPSPENGSINNPLSFTWSIPISDPEGDTFSWTIQCNNSQTNSGTADTNGTKSLPLSGLTYSTTYTVWVNATDPTGSGQYTRRWHTFTTMSQPWSNKPPTFSNPSPVNGSAGVNRFHATNITVNDLDGNSTTVCFWYSTTAISGPWIKTQQNNSVAANTTVRDINSSYSSGWNTQYWWKVTAYDGHVNSSVIYTFTTMSQPWSNKPPTFSNPSPVNGSAGVNRFHATNITVNDLDGNSTTVCFYYSLSNSPYSWVKSQQNNSVTANSTVKDINSSYSSNPTAHYWWKVTANDGHTNSTVIYTFTTKWVNRVPTFSSPSPTNSSTNVNKYHATNVTVSDLDGNATTVCFYYSLSNSPYSWTKSQQNNSVTANITVRDINSSYSSSPTAQYWWKVTANDGHTNSTVIYTFTTKWVNRVPTFSSPSPTNGSINVNRYHATNVTVSDLDGNATTVCFYYSLSNSPYSWVKSQQNNSVPVNTTVRDINSSYSSNYSTQYWWKVTAYDGHANSSAIYTFTTKQPNNPPVFGAPSPANGSTGNLVSLTWSIPINDPEGNIFSWTIQCSNGQTTSGTGASNGTKSLVLSGLTNLTTYKVWVNATDPTGSGRYTRKWYNFTTIASPPPQKPTITGPTNGKTGVSYIYNFVTADPDGNDVYYRIDWGDGSPVTEWYGPYHSGQVMIVSQTFSTVGTFIIKCQAKDTYNASSDWGQLDVTMPVSINLPPLFHQFLEKLFERFPHAFPILRQLLGY